MRAQCDPKLVESAASAFRGAQGAVPGVVDAVFPYIADLVSDCSRLVRSLEASLEAARFSPDGQSAAGRISCRLAAAKDRQQKLTWISSRLKALADMATRIDSSCASLAEHLDEVAMLARDVARGGLPEPSPRKVSASPSDIQASLNDVLWSAQVLSSDLPSLPSGGPEAPADPRDRIEPTDKTGWWER